MAQHIRIGLAGLGRAGWGMHCPELQTKQDKFAIVAACDIIPERRDRMAAKYGCRLYDNINDLAADPGVELVDVATRSPDHFAHAAAALRAGKHVFLEKPITVSYAEARKLRDLAAKSPGKLFVRHQRRFEPGFLHIREIIASGLLGNVYHVQLARIGYSRRDDWQAIVGCGGGQLLNWGPHVIDHALQFLESPVKRIWSDLKRIAAVGDAEDHLRIVLTGENDRVVEVMISGGAALGAPEYFILGTKGALAATGNSIQLRHLDPKAALPPRTADPGPPGESFGSPETLPWIEQTLAIAPRKSYDIWDELYAAIRNGTTFPITLDEAVETMRVISAVKKGTPFEMRRPKK